MNSVSDGGKRRLSTPILENITAGSFKPLPAPPYSLVSGREPDMPVVNNAMYDALGHLWWDDAAGFELTSLRYCVNPWRYGYFKRKLGGLNPPGNAVLDVGCGGGYLAEEFARDGFRVTGVDPSANTIAAACRHAEQTGLPIEYRVGRGESLPFPDGAFDIAACCDVLEHVDDAERVVHEISRTLKPGGLFLFDTVNRTLRSKIVLIKLWQDWNIGGFGQPDGHVWEKFIKPAELAAMMRSADLAPGEMRGMAPRKSPLAMVCALWRVRTGRLQGAAVAREFAMRETGDLGMSYMGWAVKQPGARAAV